ncbi:MAG: hypothetical protein WA863_14515 [Methyloceanibacter sp.]
MIAHPLDKLSCHFSGRTSRAAFVQKPAVSQKFDISKDLLSAQFGSSLAMSQELRGGNLAGHGRQCRNQAGNASSPAKRLATNAALFALIPFLLAGKPAISQQTICDEVQNYVNMLVDHTKTTCIPVDASSDTFAFLVLSSEPIFSVKDSKKAWLIAVVLSLGNAMNGQTDVKTGELYVADADMKTNVAYALPVDLAKSLQKDVAAGKLQLAAMYEKIEKRLVHKELPKP